jgi:hypothetical protein
MYSINKSTNMHVRQPYLNQGRSNFQFGFYICSIIYLLTQLEFCCVNLIDASRRKRKRKRKKHPHTSSGSPGDSPYTPLSSLLSHVIEQEPHHFINSSRITCSCSVCNSLCSCRTVFLVLVIKFTM